MGDPVKTPEIKLHVFSFSCGCGESFYREVATPDEKAGAAELDAVRAEATKWLGEHEHVDRMWICCDDAMPDMNQPVLLCWKLGVDDWTVIEAQNGSYADYWIFRDGFNAAKARRKYLWWRPLIAGQDYPIGSRDG